MTNNAYAEATNLSLDKEEENTKLTKKSKETKKIVSKQKPTEATQKYIKKKKTQLNEAQKCELKALSQKKCKHVQKMFENTVMEVWQHMDDIDLRKNMRL